MVFALVGYRHKAFKVADGTEISGYELHLMGTDPSVTGETVERIFASDAKCSGFVPVIGNKVEVQYNRYGKIDRVIDVT